MADLLINISNLSFKTGTMLEDWKVLYLTLLLKGRLALALIKQDFSYEKVKTFPRNKMPFYLWCAPLLKTLEIISASETWCLKRPEERNSSFIAYIKPNRKLHLIFS